MKSSLASNKFLEDFSGKCRICLQEYRDMIDIFGSGISDRIMKVTCIKVNNNDRLPSRVCQDCNRQLEEFQKFQELAKDSDNYLRTLLLTEQSFSQGRIPNRFLGEVGRKRQKFYNKYVKKKKYVSFDKSENSSDRLGNDKMYLILVTDASSNAGSQNEICIKDLNMEKGNVELTDFCRSLVKRRSNDHTYPSKQLENLTGNSGYGYENQEGEHFPQDTDPVVIDNTLNRNIYSVNLFIYECDKCEESFEFYKCLAQHVVDCHESNVPPTHFNYICPICCTSESDKNLFMDHLKEHKDEGYLFFKVDKTGRLISQVQEFEREIFEIPGETGKPNIKCKIFKVGVACYKCLLCNKLELKSSVVDHLRECSFKFRDKGHITYHVKYMCPACCDSWIDDGESFYAHLISHKKDDVFFVKVNDVGDPLDLETEDVMFTPFEKALEALSFSGGNDNNLGACDRSTVIKMQDVCSCSACDFKASSVVSLSEHYIKIHNDILPVFETSCPVCYEEFKLSSAEERIKFCSHVKAHKEEGIHFLRVNADGTVVKNSSDSSGVFTEVKDFFAGKVSCPELEFIKEIWVPQFFMARSSDFRRHLHENEGKNLSTKEDIVASLGSSEKPLNASEREYVCEKCGRKCCGKGNYKRHFLTHAKSEGATEPQRRPPRCPVCSKVFSNRATLKEHKKRHGDELLKGEEAIGEDSGRAMCEVCGRRLSNYRSLAKHRKLHAETGREGCSLFRCEICERGFRREALLERHVAAHLNPKYFECQECKLPLPSLASLQRHRVVHESGSDTFDCKVCKVSFLTEDRLVAHQTHAGHHQGYKRFQCNVCHESFFVGKEFTQHIKIHPKYKMSECTLCGKRLSTMQSLMLHLDRHFESNRILCPHCGKQFFEERNYHRHLLMHEGVRPFACDFQDCKKSFYTYFELNRHKKYHNNTRDFSCSYCPKSFHEANHLKVHVRTHTGERPYTCPHCSKGFVTRTRCKQHINLIHQGVGCDMIRSSISKKVAVFEAFQKA